MSNYPSKMPEEPTGIGSIIRVVFKYPGDCDPETFYIGSIPRLWVEYGSDIVEEFTWEQLLRIVKYGEAEVFEVVYEGFGATERNGASGHHIKDWIWGGGAVSLKRNMELTCDGCGVKEHISSMDFAESGQVLEDFIADALLGAVEEGWTVVSGGDFCQKCSTEKGMNLGDEGAVV